ncbi:MAG: hypothetical protein COA78_06760 [Blastopirellula sp.]|nr:MAG: hypothetical protein COA78_06760 [Blastopirellula sp.]
MAISNQFDEVLYAVRQAETTQRAVDANTGAMVRLIKGRLRSVDLCDFHNVRALKVLKKELNSFSMVTGKWK